VQSFDLIIQRAAFKEGQERRGFCSVSPTSHFCRLTLITTTPVFAGHKRKLWRFDSRAGNEETADMVREVGAPVFADVCDLSDKEDVKRAAKKAREQFGDITILVNNAGR